MLILAFKDFYHLDYLTSPNPQYRGSSPNSLPTSPISEAPMSPLSPMERSFHAPRKLNLAMVEDPLLAMAASSTPANTEISKSATPTYPLSPLSPPDAARWFHGKYATPSLNSVMDENESEVSEPASVNDQEAYLSTSNLMLHIRVYAIAEK
jgi:hypothetical protein